METERRHEVRDQGHRRDWWQARMVHNGVGGAGGATGSWVVLVDHELETGSVDCEIDFRWW
jgi:hypothetical protein